MAENSKIEWTDHTFNPWLGCTKISPACDYCYAEGWAKRTGNAQLWTGERRRTSAANWRLPIKWNREAERSGVRRKVFCASLADVFDNQAEGAWRCDLWDLIWQTPHLDWLLLTKRPQNIRSMLPRKSLGALADWGDGWPNVWLGTTVENQTEADRRIPHLLRVPAKVRFLSCEPLLRWIVPDLRGINWVICGGESGHGARPMHPEWARSLREQCVDAGVPFFFKQWGEWREFDHGSPDIEVYSDREYAESILAVAESPGWITRDGRFLRTKFDLSEDDTPCRLMERVGKKRAGALLDGREWRQFPRIASALERAMEEAGA